VPKCGIYLGDAGLVYLAIETRHIDFIETYASPIVRNLHWPNGAKSAMSITGKLDALSLPDYLSRLVITLGVSIPLYGEDNRSPLLNNYLSISLRFQALRITCRCAYGHHPIIY